MVFHIKTTIIFLLTGLFFLGIPPLSQLHAQEKNKKVIIITKTIDKDGNETIERIEKEGTDLDDLDVDELIKKHLGEDVNVDINIDSKNKKPLTRSVRVTKKKFTDENGHTQIDVNVDVQESAEALSDERVKEITKEEEEEFILLKPGTDANIKWKEKNGETIIIEGDDNVKIFKKGDKTIIRKEHIIIKEGTQIDEQELKRILKEKGVDINLDELKTNKKTASISQKLKRGNPPRPTLGIYMNADSHRQGALVSGVIEDSPADKIGIKKGDLILAFEDSKIRDHHHLSDLIRTKKGGDQVKLQIQRGGEEITLSPRLKKGKAIKQFHQFGNGDKKPKWMRDWESTCDEAAKKPAKCRKIKIEERPWLGVEIKNLDNNNGIVITKVFEDTAAEEMGLKEGDIIIRINRTDFSNMDQLVDFIQTQESGQRVKLNYSRAGKKDKIKGYLGKREKRSVVWEDCNKEELLEKAQQLAAQKNKEQAKIEPKSRILDLSGFDLFPNPTSGNFKLKFQSQTASPLEIKVLDITGKTVYREFIRSFSGNYQEEISIEDSPSGTYLLQVTQEGQVFTKKLILNRNY